MEFECPYCGWMLEGGDETGVHVFSPTGDYEGDDFEFCFHCGKKMPDSLEKLLERMESYAQKNEGYVDGSKVGNFAKELRALIERDA